MDGAWIGLGTGLDSEQSQNKGIFVTEPPLSFQQQDYCSIVTPQHSTYLA